MKSSNTTSIPKMEVERLINNISYPFQVLNDGLDFFPWVLTLTKLHIRTKSKKVSNICLEHDKTDITIIHSKSEINQLNQNNENIIVCHISSSPLRLAFSPKEVINDQNISSLNVKIICILVDVHFKCCSIFICMV